MSRIGNKAVEIPDKVKVNIGQDGAVAVEGPKGKLHWTLPRQIKANVADNKISLVREAETRAVKALHGLSRSLVHNMVQGVSTGFTKDLIIEGVGFKAAVQGQVLNLSLGFSHPILFPIPKDIKITVAENTKISIAGIDKKVVGQVAARARRDDLTPVDEADLVAQLLGLFEVVRGEQDRRPALAPDALEIAPQAAPARGIQARRRLIQEEHLWPMDQAAHDLELAAHPAGVGPYRLEDFLTDADDRG